MSGNVHPRATPFQNAVAALLLILMAVLSGAVALRESITVDEVAHIGAGVSYLQRLDLRMNEEHPPLAKILAAAPLVFRGVHADYSSVPWTFSDKFFQGTLGEWSWGHQVALRWNDPRPTLTSARTPMLLLTLLLGLVLYILGTRLGNGWGGLLSLAAYVSTPAFLVFGPLVLTDVAVTLFCVLTMWTFADMWRNPSRNTLLWFGLSFAGAVLSKFSSGILLFGFLAFSLSLRRFPLPTQPSDRAELLPWRRLRSRCLWKGIGLAALIVYAVYFVLSWHQPTDSLARLGSSVPALILRRLLMPPWLYLRGLLIFVLQSRRATFILGRPYAHGVWFYFPVLFVLKSTLAFLVLLLVALAVAFKVNRTAFSKPAIPPEFSFHWRALWTFLFVFVAACILGGLDISIRHFTVPIALVILALSLLPRVLEELRGSGWAPAQAVAALVAVVACASVGTAVREYPNYFPFVNSLGFGRPAYTLVNDSNLDWNQALPQAQAFVERHGWQHVLIVEYGFSDPTVYIPGAEFWDCQQPRPSDAGRYVIVSAGMIEDGSNCLWLMNYSHEALAGGSMYALQLPAAIPSAGAPGGPPLPGAFRTFGGIKTPFDFRRIFFDCVRDPNQLQPTFDRIMAAYIQSQKKP